MGPIAVGCWEPFGVSGCLFGGAFFGGCFWGVSIELPFLGGAEFASGGNLAVGFWGVFWGFHVLLSNLGRSERCSKCLNNPCLSHASLILSD